MLTTDLIKLSTRMFRSRPVRTWLTVLGISVGIGAVLFLVSLGYGLQNLILRQIVFNQAMLSLTVMPGGDLVPIDNKAIQDFLTIPGVTNVEPLARVVGQISFNDLYSTVEIRGVNAEYFGYAGTTVLAGGVYSNDNSGQILISESILKLFDITDSEKIIGQELEVKLFEIKEVEGNSFVEIVDMPIKYKVRGIVKDSQESFIYLPLGELQKVINIEHFDQTQVKVANSKDLAPVKDMALDKGFQVQSLSETIDQANKIFRVIQIVLGLFGAVALVVSAIGMFNTMTVTLLERTNEIGIMRALGASRSNLSALFLTESIIIGFLGGVGGIVIGIFSGTVFNFIINSLAAHFGGAKTSLFDYQNWFLIVILMISITIGFFSGIVPARRAAKMDPLEALRYK